MDISFTMQDFWIPLFQIIIVNIVLSGDNAVVIALAARSLPPHQQKKAIAWGSGAAIFMRILLTIFAVALLQYPYLKFVGAFSCSYRRTTIRTLHRPITCWLRSRRSCSPTWS